MEDRFDYVFSYWLFAWWVLYALKMTRHSPAVWLWGAVLFEMTLLLVLIVQHYPLWYIVFFVSVNAVIKGWPLWSMRHETPRGIWPGLVLYFTYLAWLHVNGESGPKSLERALRRVKERKPLTVGINTLLSKFFKSGPIHDWISS